MKKKLTALGLGPGSITAFAAVTAASSPASSTKSSADSLSGAGSTFVSPLVSKWQVDYPAKTGVEIHYNPIGSGGGIAAITARTVDFGASDAPLTPDQAKACNGCVQIPWALAGTSIAYNVPGLSSGIKMHWCRAGEHLPRHIKKWNASAIKKVNPSLNLPDMDITPVFRSDGSGTSYNFTDYLSSCQPDVEAEVRRLDPAGLPRRHRCQG